MKKHLIVGLFLLLLVACSAEPGGNIGLTPSIGTATFQANQFIEVSVTTTREPVATSVARIQATKTEMAKAALNLTATVLVLMPSSIPTQTATNTITPRNTPTPNAPQNTPTSTTVFEPQDNTEQSLAGIGTPFVQSNEIILEENLARLTELAKWGKGTIFDVVFSPNGEWLGVATATGVYLYDTTAWEDSLAINFSDMVTSIAFSSDGKQLAIGFYSGFVQVMDLDSNEILHVFETDYVPSQFEYLDNDRYLLSTSNYSQPKLWSFETNSFVNVEGLVDEKAKFVVPSVTGETFATVVDAELRLWDLKTGTFSHAYQTDMDAYDIYGIAKTRDYYALSQWHGELELRKLNTGELVWESSAWCQECVGGFNRDEHSPKCDYGYYDVQPPEFINLQFSPDEKYLITDLLGRVQWRDVSTGKVVRQFEARTDVTFSPEKDLMAWATSDGVIKVERISDNQEIITLDDYFTPGVYYAEFEPNGKQIVIKDWYAFKFRVVNDGRLFRSLNVNDLDFAPDGSQIALGYNNGEVEIRKSSDFSLIEKYQSETNPITQIEFSPAGNWLLSVHDCVVYATDTTNWSNRYSIIGSYGPASISITPDEERFLFEQRGLDLYQLSDGQWVENRNFDAEIDKNEVSYTLDAKTLLSSDAVRWAELNVSGDWDLIGAGSFSPDGYLFATVDYWDGKIFFWRASDGELLLEIENSTHYLQSISFSPDGRLMAISSSGGTVSIWGISP